MDLQTWTESSSISTLIYTICGSKLDKDVDDLFVILIG